MGSLENAEKELDVSGNFVPEDIISFFEKLEKLLDTINLTSVATSNPLGLPRAETFADIKDTMTKDGGVFSTQNQNN
jgi:hypothetical protein